MREKKRSRDLGVNETLIKRHAEQRGERGCVTEKYRVREDEDRETQREINTAA